MSLPPMPRVTMPVVRLSASNWGGFGPGVTPCWFSIWSVVAPLQLTSRRIARPVNGATRCG